MVIHRQKPKGFIAIVSLLIVTTISMFFAMVMLLDGVTNASLSMSSIYYEDARINMSTCLEDVLLRIKKEEVFNRNLSYQITDDDSCSTTIEWFAPAPISPGISERLANLEVTGLSYGFTRTFRYELRIARHDVNYSDGSLEYLNNIDFISTETTNLYLQ